MLQPTKNPFIDTLKAVLNDVKWFLFLLLVTMFGWESHLLHVPGPALCTALLSAALAC